MTEETPREKMERLFVEYHAITREAFETEGHFYADQPKTPELYAKHKAAYKAFDDARKEVWPELKEEKK